jgi:lysozyme family protein
MANFDKALPQLLVVEGGYVNDPDDLGGETYKGIARRFNPTWSGWARVDAARSKAGFPAKLAKDSVLQSAVRDFYKQHYWDKFQGDAISVQAIADELFDSAVNLGVTRAVGFLQRALNVLNRNGTAYADIVEDGAFGPASLQALASYLRSDPPTYLLKVMGILQGAHYIDLMTRSPVQEKYARGWLQRV